MKTLYLDCGMGVAGDMLMGALIELIPEKETFIEKINTIGIPNVKIEAEQSVKCGIVGTHMKVLVKGNDEEHMNVHHEHEQEHKHHHEHHHMSLPDIAAMVSQLLIPEEVKADILNVYHIIAEAEGKVHGRAVSEVHFHEVGMMDAIADITGCALLIRELGIEQIIVSPINVGFGQVRCAHGILPVPAPATVNILVGIPFYAGNVEGELCTPTGAALVKHFAGKFSKMPELNVEEIGYGMGSKDFEAANCVRALLGDAKGHTDEVIELSCNMDDMTPEEIGYAMEVLLKNGALDVYTIPIGMKKSRPGILLSVMCKEKTREQMGELLFRHTTTIGIREYRCNRMIMERKEKIIESPYGQIHVKETSGYGAKKEKMEYEDLKNAAERNGMSIREIKESITNK